MLSIFVQLANDLHYLLLGKKSIQICFIKLCVEKCALEVLVHVTNLLLVLLVYHLEYRECVHDVHPAFFLLSIFLLFLVNIQHKLFATV